MSRWLAEKGSVLRDDQQYKEAALSFEASLILDRELEDTHGAYWNIAKLACIPKLTIQDIV